MSILFILFTILLTSQGVFSRSPYAVKETHYAPRKWAKLGRANASDIINLQIVLKQNRFEELEKHLYGGNRDK